MWLSPAAPPSHRLLIALFPDGAVQCLVPNKDFNLMTQFIFWSRKIVELGFRVLLCSIFNHVNNISINCLFTFYYMLSVENVLCWSKSIISRFISISILCQPMHKSGFRGIKIFGLSENVSVTHHCRPNNGPRHKS